MKLSVIHLHALATLILYCVVFSRTTPSPHSCVVCVYKENGSRSDKRLVGEGSYLCIGGLAKTSRVASC